MIIIWTQLLLAKRKALLET